MKPRHSQKHSGLVAKQPDYDEDQKFQRYTWLLSSLPTAACLDVGKLFRRYLRHRDMSQALEDMQDIVIPVRMSRKRPLRSEWIKRKARQYLKTVVPWGVQPASPQ
jgi:hypothetical protein